MNHDSAKTGLEPVQTGKTWFVIMNALKLDSLIKLN